MQFLNMLIWQKSHEAEESQEEILTALNYFEKIAAGEDGPIDVGGIFILPASLQNSPERKEAAERRAQEEENAVEQKRREEMDKKKRDSLQRQQEKQRKERELREQEAEKLKMELEVAMQRREEQRGMCEGMSRGATSSRG